MEFGRVPAYRLYDIDFTLPPDPAFNNLVLTGNKEDAPKVYLGCSKWGRNEWVGKIYPPHTSEKEFLSCYGHHYNSIELNATHYKIYGEKYIRKWAEKTAGKGFIYCPKMYQGVTHEGKLAGKSRLTNEFLDAVAEFKEQLGPIFIQVSDSFGPSRKTELFDYLAALPRGLQFFLEVRHHGWFDDAATRNELFSFLKQQKIGAVITDTSSRRDCAHMQLSIPKAFIRYVGNSLHPTDYKRIDEWVARIKQWIAQGIEEIYFFMHMHDEAFSPELTVYMVDKLNAACGLKLKKPEFVNQNLLF
ncbi:DUF72 domain-containing protein [Parasediminibacterium sp. JCM 36343]|uniref:DUF72 domain-containing protein n=1 Tax=Parasediminibacterium sp. JCM 36343 TaxID=3374279 RepID=UPI00397D5166